MKGDYINIMGETGDKHREITIRFSRLKSKVDFNESVDVKIFIIDFSRY